ncbi:CSEP0220 putative effector protein [Blumeria hordei DH14]|uniref:CSEP0220 putative effector protein n=1 Tax=Blumeria graminis f. sp. hordei (strain DH14) TaxID=546991 RepID=N1J676_BLUG1|nr:CSEP0220 putative effector protein [Blumeria hordei DH14]
MKNLSFVSLALFLSHLMPVLAVKDYTCGGVVIPAKKIRKEIKKKYYSLPIQYDHQYSATGERDRVSFDFVPPAKAGSSKLSVDIGYDMRLEITSMTVTRDSQVIDCY